MASTLMQTANQRAYTDHVEWLTRMQAEHARFVSAQSRRAEVSRLPSAPMAWALPDTANSHISPHPSRATGFSVESDAALDIFAAATALHDSDFDTSVLRSLDDSDFDAPVYRSMSSLGSTVSDAATGAAG